MLSFATYAQSNKLCEYRSYQQQEKCSRATYYAKRSFWNNHLETYYGATAYLVYSKKSTAKIIKTLKSIANINQNLIKHYKKMINHSDYLFVVIDENDIEFVTIYSYIYKDDIVTTVLDKVAMDWFENEDDSGVDNDRYVEDMFGVQNTDIIDSYNY